MMAPIVVVVVVMVRTNDIFMYPFVGRWERGTCSLHFDPTIVRLVCQHGTKNDWLVVQAYSLKVSLFGCGEKEKCNETEAFYLKGFKKNCQRR
jgi:hypothetical protein